MKKFVLFAFVWISFETTGYSADFFCAAGNVGCLISAIEIANANGEDNSIFLEIGEYTLHNPNGTNPLNGLPAITGRIRIAGPEGIGSTIERDPSAPHFRLFEIAAGGSVVLDWLGIRNGDTSPSSVAACGGAILNAGTLTINRTAIYKNQSALRWEGGGICSTGKLSISNSEISRNMAGGDSGGGAIFSSGSLLVEDSRIYSNSADTGVILSSGTGVLLRTTISDNGFTLSGAIANFGTLWIEDSSIARNYGGAIENFGTLSIVNTTIFQNLAGAPGGGILNFGNASLKNTSVIANVAIIAGIENKRGHLSLQNSILALNTTSSASKPSDCDSITSLGNNIIGTIDGCSVVLRSSDIVGDPGVGSFIEDVLVYGNGHVPLMPGSPAIGHGNDGACTPRDQLGEPRSGICDIGAVEFQGNHKDKDSKNKHHTDEDDRHDGDHHDSNNVHR